MKWLMVLILGFIASGCTFYNQEQVEYRQVLVVPTQPAVETVSVGVYGIQTPLNVTTTTIDYY